MTPVEFVDIRKKMAKTQRQLAELLGVSLKAVHSYEQGWRAIPSHVERQIFFLLSCKASGGKSRKPCWLVKKCNGEKRRKCLVREMGAGRHCWMVGGEHCKEGQPSSWNRSTWPCRNCEVIKALL
jgi:hypothetical protein